MPRAKATIEEEVVEKKTPRKRAAPKTKEASTKAGATKAKTATRKTAVKPDTKKPVRKTPVKKKTTSRKEVVDEVEEIVEEVEVASKKEVSASVSRSGRKAPTSFAGEAAKKRAVKTQVIVVAVLLFIGVGSSAAVGFTDSEAGQINVAQTIKERNERMANMVDVDGPTVVAASPSTLPDGGFIGVQPTSPVAQPPQTSAATSTATSTDATTGTSTDDVIIEEEETATTTPSAASSPSVMDTATTTVTAADVVIAQETVAVIE